MAVAAYGPNQPPKPPMFADNFSNWWNATPGADGAVPSWTDVGKSFLNQDERSLVPILGITSALNGAIGAFYGIKAAKLQLESQASAMRFKSDMAKINARGAEVGAQGYMWQGERAGGTVALKAGQTKSSAKAVMAARGIQLGVGNAAEVIATTDLMKTTDMITVNANAVRAAEAMRTQAVGFQNESLLSGVSSSNMMASAGTISPWSGVMTNMMGSASTLSSAWYADKRLAGIMAKLQP